RAKNGASPRSRNLNGPGKADYIFSAADIDGYPSLGLLLWDRIGGQFPNWDLAQEWPPTAMIEIDGRLYDGLSIDLDIDPRTVENMEVLRDPAYTMVYETQYNDGQRIACVIVITTKSGQAGVGKQPTGRLQFTPPGIHLNTQ